MLTALQGLAPRKGRTNEGRSKDEAMTARNSGTVRGRPSRTFFGKTPNRPDNRESGRRLLGAAIGSAFVTAFVLFAVLQADRQNQTAMPAVMVFPAAMPGIAPPAARTTTGLEPERLSGSPRKAAVPAR
jgi:hypothetical protein